MRPAPTWFELDVISSMIHLGVLDPELSGGSGTFRGYAYGLGGALFGIVVLDRSLWDLSHVCPPSGNCLVFFLPRLLPVTSICRISFALFFFLSNLYTFLKRRLLGQRLRINYM